MVKIFSRGGNESASGRGKCKNVLLLVGLLMVVVLLCYISSTSHNKKSLLEVYQEYSIYVSPASAVTVTSSHASAENKWDRTNPLGIPSGQAKALPSIRVDSDENRIDRSMYGGEGDKAHLGGFIEIDLHGISPAVWKFMITDLGVHSVLDVGCGRGISTSWFHLHGCDVLCAEGSHDAVEKSMLPDVPNQVVEHDFSRGPWWPGKTYDAVWAVEFLEHVGVQYHFNYITAFRKAALIFVTSSRWGGWHHVEVHPDEWWIQKYESYGFRFSQELTDKTRTVAKEETAKKITAPNGKPFNAQHVWLSVKVFINPVVASLPEHAHLFPVHGCYEGRPEGVIKNRICGTGDGSENETPLPKAYWPIELTPEMDAAWETLVKKHITVRNR